MKMKKWVASLIMLVMFMSLLAACTKDNNTSEAPKSSESKATEAASTQEPVEEAAPAGAMPIVKDPITIKVFTGKPADSTDWNEVMLWKEYEKLTNVHIQWDPQVPQANLAEKLNITMAGGSYPDAFYASQFSAADMLKYGQEGALIPLNELIKKYAPNIQKLFDENPDIKKGATMADGNIYTIPTIVEPDYMSVRQGGRVWYKKEWLDKLQLAEPQTTDDFYNLLKTVVAKDPAGGGKTEGWSGFYSFDQLINYLLGSWGLNNHGVQNPNFDVDPQSGNLRFIPTDPKYKEVLQLISKMYQEKLLGNIMETDFTKNLAATMEGKYFAGWSQDPTKSLNLEGYVGMPALKGPYGDQLYSYIGSPILWSGGLVITKNMKNPEVLIKWIDYLYGDEGSKLFFMGKEGVTYNKKADGTYTYVDSILKPAGGLTFSQEIAKYLTWGGGLYPGVVRKAYFLGAESTPASQAATDKVTPYFPKDIWAPFTFTAAENEVLASVGADINSYLAEMKTKFLTGKTPFSEWDKYVKQLNDMGLDKYVGVYNDAYKRYQQ